MSEEFKLKFGFDASDATKAAQVLPDAFKKIEGQNSRDFQIPSGRVSSVNLGGGVMLPSQAAPVNQSQQQSAGEREAERIKNAEKKHADEILKLKMAEYAKKKKLEEQAAKDAQDWSNNFAKNLTGGLISSLAPLALFYKGMSLITDWVGRSWEAGMSVNKGVTATGMSAEEVKMSRGIASIGNTMTRDESQQVMEQAMAKARNYAKGISSEGALGLERFGMGREAREDVLSGKASYIEMLAKMSDAYKEYGRDAQFANEMTSIFGEGWEKLRPQLLAGREVLTKDLIGSTTGVSVSDMFSDENEVNLQRKLHGLPPIKKGEWMGGTKGGGVSSFAMPSSLQAMGGGDVLSAINRGPMDKVADNTERTANATEAMAGSKMPDSRSPVILGY